MGKTIDVTTGDSFSKMEYTREQKIKLLSKKFSFSDGLVPITKLDEKIVIPVK